MLTLEQGLAALCPILLFHAILYGGSKPPPYIFTSFCISVDLPEESPKPPSDEGGGSRRLTEGEKSNWSFSTLRENNTRSPSVPSVAVPRQKEPS